MLTSLLPLRLVNHMTNSYTSHFLLPHTFSMSRVVCTPKVFTKPGLTQRSAHFRRNLRPNNGHFVLILISLICKSMLKLLVTTLLILLLMINLLQRQSEIQSGTLCLRCGETGHRANRCNASQPSKTGQSFLVEWKADRLVTIKSSKQICVMFNVRGTCTDEGSFRFGEHSCSLCGDSKHGAYACTCN